VSTVISAHEGAAGTPRGVVVLSQYGRPATAADAADLPNVRQRTDCICVLRNTLKDLDRQVLDRIGLRTAKSSDAGGREEMNAQTIAAIVLIVVGALGIGYGGFSYTSETHNANMGPIQMSFSERERVNIPMWAGVGAIAVGALLLLVRRKIV
jgi:hypothetical protein